MNTIRVNITVTGTDDYGVARSFSGTASIYAQQVVDNSAVVDTTKRLYTGDDTGFFPRYVYIENQGTVDVAYALADAADDSVSLVVPPGASTFVTLAVWDKPLGQAALYMWSQSSTAKVRFILFS